MNGYMRPVLLALFLAAAASPAAAQPAPVPCYAASPTGRVNVVTHDGMTLRGTLLCLTSGEVVLATDGAITRTPLAEVRRILKPADPVWDGAAKGAAVVLTFWGFACGFCDGDSYLWKSLATWTVIGAAVDALQTNRKTIYEGTPKRAALNWRVRF